ncbi:MAG: SRPBCC family protein [Pseudomonadota bacterium]
MATASVQYDFDLPVEVIWDLVGEFGNMSKWTGLPPETCIADGEEVGAIRTLTLPDGGTIIDRLEAKTERSYSYSIINMDKAPLPFSSYQATLSVSRISETKTRLDWRGVFEPRDISEAEAITFAQNMYQRGLDMMKRAAAKL